MSSNLIFKRAQSAADFNHAKPFIFLLNPYLSEEAYRRYLAAMQLHENYTLYVAYQQDVVIGICGYWIATKFYCGKYLEIDNFIIHPHHRGKNYGAEFLIFLEEIARNQNCETLMLDAYLENKAGHKFYERAGYKARGYHFIKKIEDKMD